MGGVSGMHGSDMYSVLLGEEETTLEHLGIERMIILTRWRRNYFFLILARPVYKM